MSFGRRVTWVPHLDHSFSSESLRDASEIFMIPFGLHNLSAPTAAELLLLQFL